MAFGAARRATGRVGVVVRLIPPAVSALRASLGAKRVLPAKVGATRVAAYRPDVVGSVVATPVIAVAAEAKPRRLLHVARLFEARRRGLIRKAKVTPAVRLRAARPFSGGALVRQVVA